MGYWNAYFALKLYLAWTAKIQPAWGLNLLLAILVLVPLRRPWLVRLRQCLAISLAIVLLASEAGLSISRLPALLDAAASFAPSYAAELAARALWPGLAWVAALLALVWLAGRRFGQWPVLALLAAAAIPLWLELGPTPAVQAQSRGAVRLAGPGPNTPVASGTLPGFDLQLAGFRTDENRRRVRFGPMTPEPAAQFDIIILHTCSLSWDDLDAANARNHPVLSRFDYVFDAFSSGSSYSNPTAIRLLRASCGQQSHDALFRPTSAGCHLFAQLAQAGYEPQALFNHDGEFGNFKQVVEREIGIYGVKAQLPRQLPTTMIAFDGSALANDYAVLDKWHRTRQANGGKPVALYYNTVSLHDGNQLLGESRSSLESYPHRLQTLLDDVERLAQRIERSGRRAAIVLVPEHGAALRSNGTQMAGWREIPTPELVHVPVGVRLVGLPPAQRQAAAGPVRISQPSSYVALAQLLANLVANSPYHPGAPALTHYAAGLPSTPMVGENEGVVTMALDHGYLMRQGHTWQQHTH